MVPSDNAYPFQAGFRAATKEFSPAGAWTRATHLTERSKLPARFPLTSAYQPEGLSYTEGGIYPARRRPDSCIALALFYGADTTKFLLADLLLGLNTCNVMV